VRPDGATGAWPRVIDSGHAGDDTVDAVALGLPAIAALTVQIGRARELLRLAAQHGLPWHRPTPPHSFAATPRRTFRWYRGQKHYSGTYWSSTEL
jgi:hypothetical protein